MQINAMTLDPQRSVGAAANRANDLGADDFLQLLVTQLTHQDPLSPTSNQDLLQQLSSIRDIQLSSTLVDSLKTLTGNQRFGSAAALIGKSVTGHLGDQATGPQSLGGIVTGVRFDADGKVFLELDGGQQLPLENLESVASADRTADSLIGQLVRGLDRTKAEPVSIEGIVTAVRRGENGELLLELDTGEQLRLSDLT